MTKGTTAEGLGFRLDQEVPELPYRQRLKKEALIVLPGGCAQRGGIGQAVRNLLEGWRGWRDAPSYRVVDSWHIEWKIRRSPISPLYFVGAIVLIVAARCRGRLGLLHLNMAPGGSILRKGLLVWLGALLRTPVIVHVHASSIADQVRHLPTTAQALLRITLNRARFLVVLGRCWRDFFVEELGIDARRVVAIPCGVPEPDTPGRTAAQDDLIRLLFLGRLGNRKGTPEVLQALASPRLRALSWSLVLAGDGDLAAMRARSELLGIAGRCKFAGWLERPQVMELLASSDVLVLPSRAEGLPVAILEAMACGLAIVTTPVGAIEDAITDHETGLLVPAGDAGAMAIALEKLILDAKLRTVLGRAAHARYGREFTVELYAARIRRLYRQCGL
jgi:glycosyltransferase involved in cell wall biosynthesis